MFKHAHWSADILSARAQRPDFAKQFFREAERAAPAGGQDVRAPLCYQSSCSETGTAERPIFWPPAQPSLHWIVFDISNRRGKMSWVADVTIK